MTHKINTSAKAEVKIIISLCCLRCQKIANAACLACLKIGPKKVDFSVLRHVTKHVLEFDACIINRASIALDYRRFTVCGIEN